MANPAAGVDADIIYAYYFYLVVTWVCLERKYVNLGGKMDFSDIL